MTKTGKKKAAQQTVFRSGNSLVLAVPAAFRRTYDIKAGDRVGVVADRQTHTLTFKFPPPKQLSLIDKENS